MMNNKILVIGSKGMLGSAFVRYLSSNNMNYVGLDYPDIDITNNENLASKFEVINPEIVINCAAYTNVDLAEKEEVKAFNLNKYGVKLIAKNCNNHNALLIHFSTDYVFDGQKQNAYNEQDETGPINVYGKSKRAGEEVVEKIASKYIIIRTSWLFGYPGNNFVETIIRLSKDNRQLKIVDDQAGCPTLTDDLVAGTFNLISSKANGLFHVCNKGTTTWNGFAREIVSLINVDCVINNITTEELGRPAPRPKNSVLDCKKYELSCVPLSDWKNALNRYLKMRKK